MKQLKQETFITHVDFMAKDPHKFYRVFIGTMTYIDTVDNNICKVFNAFIVNSRSLPLIDVLENIKSLLMERMHRNLTSISKIEDVICTRIRKKLESNKKLITQYIIKPSVSNSFEVCSKDDKFVVDFVTKQCNHRQWDLTGISCCHTCACVNYMRKDLALYVDKCYHRSTYIETYKNALKPLNGSKMWVDVEG